MICCVTEYFHSLTNNIIQSNMQSKQNVKFVEQTISHLAFKWNIRIVIQEFGNISSIAKQMDGKGIK